MENKMRIKSKHLESKHNRYGIRKSTVGTASLIVGALLVFGAQNDAQAAESETKEAVQHVAVENTDTSKVEENSQVVVASQQLEKDAPSQFVSEIKPQAQQIDQKQADATSNEVQSQNQAKNRVIESEKEHAVVDNNVVSQSNSQVVAHQPSTNTHEKEAHSSKPEVEKAENFRIGDRVWQDVNKNGKQDTGEPGVANVKVELRDKNRQLLQTVHTNGNGEYIFTGVKKDAYFIQFHTPEGYTPTVTHATSSTMENDSNGRLAFVEIVDKDDLTVDFGLIKNTNEAEKTYKIGDFVWEDINKNGKQDVGEPGIAGVTVIILNDKEEEVGRTVTDAQGHYVFNHIKNGRYSVLFETPKGYEPTIDRAPNVTQDLDSNYISSVVDIKDGDNLTIDSGFFRTHPAPPAPEEPKKPEEPKAPEQPKQPEHPEKPAPKVPEKPMEPKAPIPEKPEMPKQPEKPEQPTPKAPEKPMDPKELVPSLPKSPDDSAKPKELIPALPEAPGHDIQQPRDKEIVIPSQPLVPSETEKTDKKVNPQSTLPNTGKEEADTTLWGMLLISLGALFAVVRRPKRANKE
ncbi:SdrD B-like domain-containing protein [Staphylococcus coagulans]|uniref:SdrD B-like domain-containing protein n=1 Tax=Staphylococcus coagulans TaxID=74706 RepID=UPI002871F25B|nr:SdrD B-like domain-containing protein [Staphylococcus coagulans]MDR9833312.1 SdrD B-like domain-containing protein [Staphylococcus coagulans]